MYYAVEMPLVCARSFLKVSYSNDAKQVSAAPTQAQKTNLAIINSLYFLIQEVKSVSAHISSLFLYSLRCFPATQSLLNHLSLPEAVYSVIHTALDVSGINK